MYAAGRMNRSIGRIKDPSFAGHARMAPCNFTRRRKMPCEDVAISVMCSKGRSLEIELRQWEKETGMKGISAPAYLKAREKFNPMALRYLLRCHEKDYYLEENPKTYKGYLIGAIDGSRLNVPTTPLTLTYYGNASATGRPQAMVGLSCLYDVLNRRIIDLVCGRYNYSERSQASLLIKDAGEVLGKKPLILVLDRAFCSLSFMTELIDDYGSSFVIRCRDTRFLDREFMLAEEKGGDAIINIALSKKRLAYMKKKDPRAYEASKRRGALPLRLVLVDIEGKKMRIVTNLSHDLFSTDDIKELYRLRWGIETCFSFLKNKLQVENLSSTKPLLIEQDIFATAYLLNIAFDFANEADGESGDTCDMRYRHKMTVNRSFAIGVVKEELLSVIFAPEEMRQEMMDGIIKELKEHLIPVRDGRSYPRSQIRAPRHHRYSNTHRRIF